MSIMQNDQRCLYCGRGGERQMPSHLVQRHTPSSDPEGGARGVQTSIATKQESCPESAPRTETAYKADRLRFAVGYLAKHAKGVSLSDWDKISNDILDAAELLDAQLTKTPSADHDDGNLRYKLDIAISALEFARDGYERIDIKHIDYRVGVYATACDALDKIALPSISNHQPHAVSQGWQDDMENAPDNIPVLLAWQDWRDGQWCMEIGPAITGQRYANGYSSISHHGSATHWMPLPAPPSPAKTGGAS